MTSPRYAPIAGPITIGGRRGEALTLPNPVLAAAGCFGDASLFVRSGWQETLGGLVTPTYARNVRSGRPATVRESPAGILYRYRELDCESLTGRYSPARIWQALGVPVIVSLAAITPEDVAAMASELASLPGVAAFELNPDPASEARRQGDANLAALIGAATDTTDLPLLLKLRPHAGALHDSLEAQDAGADAIVLGHGWPALVPHEPAGDAVLAGPAILPLTLRLVAEVAGELDIPVLGCGGVCSTADALAYLAAGAAAVQVGSGLLRDPSLAARIVAELTALRF